MKKRLLCFVISLLLIVALSPAALAAQSQVSLNFNGKNLPTDVPPVVKSGRTLVPVRVISESMGADISWDGAAQKVTVTKNDSVIELNINKKEVFKNGVKFADLDVAAQIIDGRTMVPVRFVSETFGADVKWDEASQTVAVTFNEEKDGMTPEELMVKNGEAMQQYNAYKFRGEGTINIKAAQLPEDIVTTVNIEGSYKKSADKAEVYLLETINIPAIEEGPEMDLSVEIYSDGTNFYQKMSGAEWEKIDISADLTKLAQSSDPAQALQMMKDFGLILSFGNDAKIDGKDNYTLVVKVDQEKYKNFIKEIVGDSMESQNTDESVEGLDPQVINDLVDSMDIDLSEKIYIDKETLLLTSVTTDATITMTIDGNTMTEQIDMDLSVYDLGKSVTMPKVTK